MNGNAANIVRGCGPAARRLGLRGKAATAWRHAFEPAKLAATPPVWLQLTAQSAAFAGVSADRQVLRARSKYRAL